jgi:hypothetical protein
MLNRSHCFGLVGAMLLGHACVASAQISSSDIDRLRVLSSHLSKLTADVDPAKLDLSYRNGDLIRQMNNATRREIVTLDLLLNDYSATKSLTSEINILLTLDSIVLDGTNEAQMIRGLSADSAQSTKWADNLDFGTDIGLTKFQAQLSLKLLMHSMTKEKEAEAGCAPGK